MDTHESEHRFVVEDQFLCLCLTWNINGKRYDVMRDNDIIYSEAFQCRLKGIPNPDVVVVGLQETIELTATSVVGSELTGKVSERTAHWENATLRALNYGKNKGKYCCLNVISMLGLWMGVYATVEMAPYVVNCQVTSLARGAGGVIGNKGAVYFRATILSTSICFVCAHLPANREKLRKRNEEFFVIMNSKVFRDNSCSNQDLDLDTFVASGESIKIRQDQSSIRSRLQDLESRMLSNVSTSRAGKNSTADIDVEVISNDGKDDPERNAVLDRQVKSIEFLDEDLEDESLDTSFVGESNSGIAQESPLDTTFKRSDVSLEKVSERTHDRVTPLTSISEEKFRYSAWSHNIVIFLGDLNYRISQELDIHQVYSMIDTGNMEELLTYDQLLQEKDKGNVFPLFQEGVIMFPPTYKFIPGHNIYDRRPDKKLRIPAWCDRILWTTSSDLDLSMSKFDQKGSRNAISVDFICSNPASGKKVGTSASPLSYLNNNGDDLLDTPSSQSNDDDGIPPGQIEWNSDSIYYQMLDNQAKQLSVEKVELLLYESLPEFIISDHKPVRALMNIRLKSIDYRKREEYLCENFVNSASFRSSSSKVDDLVSVEARLIQKYSVMKILGPAMRIEPAMLQLVVSSQQLFARSMLCFQNSSSVISLQYRLSCNLLPPWLSVRPLVSNISPKSSAISSILCDFQSIKIQPENAKEFYWQLEFDIFEALEQDNNRIEYAKLDTKLVPVLISFEA